MTEHTLNQGEQETLLKIAREALQNAVTGLPLPQLKLDSLPASLKAEGASFVTLTVADRLRGCIGTLQAYQPLAEDVQEHTVAAALEDPRFPNVRAEELAEIRIEVSVLTPRRPLQYESPADLLKKIRPSVDGVVLEDGFRKATFLPQVWEKLPDPAQFLAQLCMKMGAPADTWQKKPLDVYTYQVQDFHENPK